MIVPVVVEGQSLRWYGRIPEIADNSIEFVQLEFRFPEDWDNMVIVAQFTQTKTYNCLLVNNRCFLPMELVAGPCEISVFGYLNEGVTRGTTIPLKLNISRSGFVSSAETPIPPTPDLYAQLIEYFSSIAGSGGGGSGSGTINPEDIAAAVEDYLSKNPPEVPDLSDEVTRAETAASEAETASRNASASANNAGNYATDANNAASSAASAANAAEEAASDAEAAADRAEEAAKVTTDLDTTLTQEGKAADAKAVGDAISKLSDGNADQSGLSSTVANLLIEILRNGVYSTDQSANITALAAELAVTEEEEPDTPVEPDEPVTPEVTLSSISATYSGGDVAVGTAVTALTGVVVTAHYSDGTSATVTGYTLSGTIAEGSNTVTVNYGGKSTTFAVTGVAESGGEDEPGDSTAEIPADATRLTYIQSSGTQYIDTGAQVRWENFLSMTADISEDIGNVYLFGAYDGTNCAYINPYRNATVTKCAWPGKEGNSQNAHFIGENVGITVGQELDSLGNVNGAYVYVRTSLLDVESLGLYIGANEPVGVSANLYLFAHNNNGTASNFASYKLREFALYTDYTRATEIIHLIPVLDPDGVACMYDTVSKQYFRNSGTGDFVGGGVA